VGDGRGRSLHSLDEYIYATASTHEHLFTHLCTHTLACMVQVAPGLYVGEMLRKPQSYLNPLPMPVDAGMPFMLFQVG
jgi:hypothetical protein